MAFKVLGMFNYKVSMRNTVIRLQKNNRNQQHLFPTLSLVWKGHKTFCGFNSPNSGRKHSPRAACQNI